MLAPLVAPDGPCLVSDMGLFYLCGGTVSMPSLGAIHCPPWLPALVGAVVTILGVGYALGVSVTRNTNRIHEMEVAVAGLDFRLCRIERALNVAPYQTCVRVWGNDQGGSP